VPEAVRAAIIALSDRIERGDSLELAIALLPFECKAALWAWWRVVKDGSGSILSFRGASAAREPGIQKRSHVYLDSGSPQSRRPE
jgi:hypothetical protein